MRTEQMLVRLALGFLVLGAARSAEAVGEPSPGAVNASTLKLPDGPGSIRGLGGSAGADVFSGQVTYAVPIDLPAGIAGFGPSLSLTYSGALGNGPMGIGWDLPLPAIRRSTRHGVPKYTDEDELELSGVPGAGRLIAAGDGTFRVEGGGHAVRVLPKSWGYTVILGSGMHYRMDHTRGPEGRPPYAWYASEARSVTDETVSFTYLDSEGQVVLSRLVWGPHFACDLTYEPRPDPIVSYREGFRVVAGRRLQRISVRSGSHELRAYTLSYDPTGDLPVSRLAKVRMTGLDGEGELPAVTFAYGTDVVPAVHEVAGALGWQLGARGVTLADVDGDGLDDLVRYELGARSWRRNLVGHFAQPVPLPGAELRPLDDLRLMDLTGDGHAEMAYVVGNTWRVYTLQSGAYVSLQTWPGTEGVALQEAGVAYADVNGDRRTDVLRARGGGLEVAFGGASGLGAFDGKGPISPKDPVVGLGDDRLELQDANGDGLADALWRGTNRLYVYYGKGDGTFANGVPYEYPWSMPIQDPAALRLVDLNRDGLLDVLRVEAGHVYWWAGTAHGFSQTMKGEAKRPGAAAYDDVVTVSDLDGDGAADVIWSGPGGLWTLGLAGPGSQAMLRTINNGLGAVTSIQYSTSAKMAREAEVAGWPWARQLPAVVPVPWRMSVSPGGGEPLREVVYRVRDGFWDALEQSFGGFLGSITTTIGDTPAETLVVETEYEEGLGMSREMRGKPWRELTRDDTGKLLSETFNTWDVAPIDDLPAGEPKLRVAVLREARVDTYEGAASPIATRSTTEYDGEAQPVRETKYGRLDRTGDESVTERLYAHNDETGVRGVVCAERLREVDGTVVRYTRHQYDTLNVVDPTCDPAATELCACSVTKGHVRAKDGWLDAVVAPCEPAPGHWVRLYEADVDAAGNVTRSAEGGVTRHVEYDGDHFHPIAERVEPTTGFALRWTLDWDPVVDLPTRLTDPNGDAREVGYDALGRTTSIRAPLGEPSTLEPVMELEYHLDSQAPGPHVVTRRLEHGLAPDGELISVVNGLGEPRYEATLVDGARRSIGDFRKRSSRGLTTQLVMPFFWTAPGLPIALPVGVATQAIAYDASGRTTLQHLPATESLPNGVTTTTTFERFRTRTSTAWTLAKPDENPVSESLAEVTQEIDGQGRIAHTERTVGGTTEEADNEYDASSALTATRLQGGAVVHTFDYDRLGRLRHGHDPDMGHRTSCWSDAGQLVATQNGVGDRIEYAYDGAGRLTGVHSIAPTFNETFTYRYDHLGVNAAPSEADVAVARAVHQLGRLARVVEPWGDQVLRYDAQGRTVAAERSIDGWSARRSTTYSPSGQALTSSVETAELGVSTPAERFRLAYGFDAAGWLASIHYSREGGVLADLWTRENVTASGAELDVALGNSLRVRTDRDMLDQSTRLRIGAVEGTPLYDVGLVRNGIGGIAKAIEHPAVAATLTRAASFGYDGAARLTSATVGGIDFGFTYDALQNMTERTVGGTNLDLPIPTGPYTYDPPGAIGGLGPRQLKEAGALTFGYDPAGRTTNRGADVLSYDARDRLRAVALASGTTLTYRYGADGDQVERFVNGEVTERHFDESLVHRNGRIELMVSAGDELVARVAVPQSVGGAIGDAQPIQYLHQGFGHGPSLITNAQGALLEERLYEPFGVLLAEEASFSGAYDLEPFAWNGKPIDPVTGWSDHGARWDATELARWLTGDPAVKGPSSTLAASPWNANPYAYVTNNPIFFWDPDGRDRVHYPGSKQANAVLFEKIIVGNVNQSQVGLLSYTLFRAAGAEVRQLYRSEDAQATNTWKAFYSQKYDEVLVPDDVFNRGELEQVEIAVHEVTHHFQEDASIRPDSASAVAQRGHMRDARDLALSRSEFIVSYVGNEIEAERQGIRAALQFWRSARQDGNPSVGSNDTAWLGRLGLTSLSTTIGGMSYGQIDAAADMAVVRWLFLPARGGSTTLDGYVNKANARYDELHGGNE